MIDWSSCSAVERDPERLSGAWVFRGSRVPVAALFENLEDGVPIGEFVELFPGVALDQARTVLAHVARSALAAAVVLTAINSASPGTYAEVVVP